MVWKKNPFAPDFNTFEDIVRCSYSFKGAVVLICEFSAKSAQDNEGECAQVIMYNWSYFYSVDPLTWSDTVLRHSVQNDIIVFHHVFKLGLLVVYGFISTQTSVNRWGLGNVSQLNHILSKTCQPLYIYIRVCVCNMYVCMSVCMYLCTFIIIIIYHYCIFCTKEWERVD